MREHPTVAIVICCFNSRDRIVPTLSAVAALRTSARIRVIVVDNASTDDTAAVVRQAVAGLSLDLSLVDEPTPGLSHARIRGWRAAGSADYIVLVDDDVSLDPAYVENAVRLMQSNPYAGACGGIGVPKSTGGEFPAWLWRGWHSHATGPQGTSEGDVSDTRGFLYGAGLVVRRAAVDELERLGFRFRLTDRLGTNLASGGDLELSYALRMCGWRLLYSQQLRFEHRFTPERVTWTYCKQLFAAYGEADAVLGFYRMVLASTDPPARLSVALRKKRLRLRVQAVKLAFHGILEGSRSVCWLRRITTLAHFREFCAMIADGSAATLYREILDFRARARALADARHAARLTPSPETT